MKTLTSFLLGCLFISPAFSQNKSSLTILSVDVQNVNMTPEQGGNLLRLETEKLNLFEVTDRYDVAYLVEKNSLKINNCYGKTCLVEVGNTIHSDKMLSGTIEAFPDLIVVTLRLIDVKTSAIEKTYVREFLSLPKEIQQMISISVREMFGLDNDQFVVESLTRKNQFSNSLNVPDKNRLRLDGPRMGFTVLTGKNAGIFTAPEYQGGFNGFPAMFQFGYQFEKQYLNEGNFQALFEFVPMITGLDQGQFIPSMTILHGLRGNKKGWEFAFGPTIALTKQARGYYDPDSGWQLESNWTDSSRTNPFPIEYRLDSRGKPTFSSGFVFAFGRSIRSGKLNIPFNAYVIPQKDGWRFGLSFGFNARKDNN